jgi:hypothetical protein
MNEFPVSASGEGPATWGPSPTTKSEEREIAQPLTDPQPQRETGDFDFKSPEPARPVPINLVGVQSETFHRRQEPQVQVNPGGPIHGQAFRIKAVQAPTKPCQECGSEHSGRRLYVLKPPNIGLTLCPVCLDRINPPGFINVPFRYGELIRQLTDFDGLLRQPLNPNTI